MQKYAFHYVKENGDAGVRVVTPALELPEEFAKEKGYKASRKIPADVLLAWDHDREGWRYFKRARIKDYRAL